MAFAIFIGGVIAGFTLAALALGLNHSVVRSHLREALHFLALVAADFKELLLLRAKTLRKGHALAPEITLREAKTSIPAADLAAARARATMKFDDFLAQVPLQMPVIETADVTEASMEAADIFKNPLVVEVPDVPPAMNVFKNPPVIAPAPTPQLFNSCGEPIPTLTPLPEHSSPQSALKMRLSDWISLSIQTVKEPLHRKALLAAAAAALLIALSFTLGFHKAQRSLSRSKAVAIADASAYDATPVIAQNPFLNVAAVEDVSDSGPADVREPGLDKSKEKGRSAPLVQKRRGRVARRSAHARPIRHSHRKETQSARLTTGFPVYSDRR